MGIDPNGHPGRPEQPRDGFAEGEARPDEFPEDEEVGRFSEGQEDLPADDPEKVHHGRFSEGQEELPEDDPAWKTAAWWPPDPCTIWTVPSAMPSTVTLFSVVLAISGFICPLASNL